VEGVVTRNAWILPGTERHEWHGWKHIGNNQINIFGIERLLHTCAVNAHQKKYVWLQHRNQMSVVEISGIQIYVTTEQKTIWTCVEWSMYHQT
jgi:hypothetical protein